MNKLLVILPLLGAAPALADVRVVATTPDLAVIARELVGTHGAVSALALPTQDPHFVDAKPSLALELSKADLLIAVGLELELGWLPNLQSGARNPKIQRGMPGYLDASTLVERLEVPTEKLDRSQGDIHPGGNPHYLYDPRRALAVAGGIAERLAAIDPDNADDYRANARRLDAKLRPKIAEWSGRLAGLRGAKVVAYHRSLAYLADWLGLEVVAHIEPKPGIPPSPGHVAQLLGRMQAEKIGLLLQEEYHPRQTAQLLASKTGARVLVLEGGARFADGEDLAERYERLVKSLESR